VKIDIWTHILSQAYLQQIETAGQRGPGPATFLLANRALHDLDVRFEVMNRYVDYRQVLTPIPGPTVYLGLPGKELVDLVRRNNEEMAELVRRHSDRFAGFAAATPLADPDAAAEEAVLAVRELGALGVQLEEDAVAYPLHEDRYDPLFAAMEELGAAVWLHPFRSPASPGFPMETAPFLLWQVFGWTFDTTITVSRLIFAGIYDKHPRLKLIAHHGGGLIPHFSGRIEMMPLFTGLDPTLSEAVGRLNKKPIEYFKMLYVDTAMFGSRHGVECVVDFFGIDHVLFGTDAPFDTKGGSHFIPVTISDVEGAVQDEAARAAIFGGNAHVVLGIHAE
jgi:predicted TIM-barrel fold metal-dependent hydrolase